MTDDSLQTLRLTTGIPGLDGILEGGFLTGGVYIIEGPPGAGKTTLASQLCFHHARAGRRALYVTLLAESHMRLLSHLGRMAFFDGSLVPDGVTYLSAFKVLETEGLESLTRTIRQSISAQNASVVVLDGLVSAEEASPTPRDFKKFIHELQIVTAMTGCVGLLLSSTERPGNFCAERTMVDGVIEVDDELVGLAGKRTLLVRKMRGTSPVRGKHTLEIDDRGVRVLPRVEVVLETSAREGSVRPGAARAGFGVSELDRMLGGGLPTASMTAIIGPTGAGKTILGLHFLDEGVRRGEPGVYFGFFERPEALLEKAARLQMALPRAHRDGLVELVWHRPVESVIDVLGHDLLRAVERTGARRLCIDSMQGFQLAAESPQRTREVMSALNNKLEAMGVTTVYTSETPDLLGNQPALSSLGVSAITQNVVWLRHMQQSNGHLTRTISVLKVRDSRHDLRVCALEITDKGARVPGADGKRARASSQKATKQTRRSTGKSQTSARKSRA